MSKKKDLSGGGKDGGLAADDKAGPDVRSKTKKPAVLAGTGSGSSAAAAALSASAGFGTAAAAPLRLAEQSGAMGPQLELDIPVVEEIPRHGLCDEAATTPVWGAVPRPRNTPPTGPLRQKD